MPAYALTDAEVIDALRAVESHPTKTAAATSLGIARGTLAHRLSAALMRGLTLENATKPAPEQAAPAVTATPIEKHDADFWRKRSQSAQADLGARERIIEELAGLRNVNTAIPSWALDLSRAKRGKSVIGCLVSDIHMGEVINPDEIMGINAFDPDICRARMRRYFEAACAVGSRWASDTDCQGAMVALAGDLISGDIHEELSRTNAMTSHEQLAAAVEVCVAGIRLLKETFGHVHVIGVPGNHGRTTHKPTAKLYASLSYDILAVSMVAERFIGDDRITFQYGKSKDQITPVFGRTVLTTHGDKIGTKGGMGFAGPILPIVRGTKKIAAQQASIGRAPYLIQHGHYHVSANPGNVLSNGSVPGYSEYADDLRAAVEPPQQWLYLMHNRWGLRERAPIQLEQPDAPERPVVRVPARMSEAA